MHLGEIGRELGLLEFAGRDVLVRLDHLTPRKQARHGLDGDFQALGLPPLLIALKLGELRAEDGVAHLRELLGGLTGADRLHQTTHGIERALGVVIGEGLIVREFVANVAKLIHPRSLGAAENGPERVVPEAIHRVEQRGLVPADLTIAVGPQARQLLQNLDLPMPFERAFQPLFDKRNEGCGQQLHALENILARALGHVVSPLNIKRIWRSPRVSWIAAACRVSSVQSAINAL